MLKYAIIAVAAAAVSAGAVIPAQAGDVLLIEQVQKEKSMHLPQRGLSMNQVESRFGAPLEKLETRGGGAPMRPPINRWVYDDYTVYFERNVVIHAVINPPRAIP